MSEDEGNTLHRRMLYETILCRRVVELEDFLRCRLHPKIVQVQKIDSDSRHRLPTFLKPDSDFSNFEKTTPTPAENMRLHQLPTLTPQPCFVIVLYPINIFDYIWEQIRRSPSLTLTAVSLLIKFFGLQRRILSFLRPMAAVVPTSACWHPRCCPYPSPAAPSMCMACVAASAQSSPATSGACCVPSSRTLWKRIMWVISSCCLIMRVISSCYLPLGVNWISLALF